MTATTHDQTNSLKQKFEDVRRLHDKFIETEKIAMLESERVDLQNQHSVLEAQVLCSSYMAKQYDNERDRIHAFLVGVFSTAAQQTTPSEDDVLCHDICVSSVVDNVLKSMLIYQGRNAATGQLMFRLTEAVQSSPVDVQREMHQLAQILPLLTPLILKDLSRPLIDLSSLTPKSESHKSSIGDGDDEAIILEAALLQSQVESLQRENRKRKEEEAFLEAAKVIAEHALSAFQKFQNRHKDALIDIVKTFFTLVQERSSIVFVGLRSPAAAADKLLASLPWWGQDELPPIPPEMLVQASGIVMTSQHDDLQTHAKEVELCTSDSMQKRRSPGKRNNSTFGIQERQEKVNKRRKPNLKRL